MGIVYRAIQRPLERLVAIKLLPSSLASDPRAISRFMLEMQACTLLVHPNIIRILDCGELEGQPFYAMELLEARTLRQLVTEQGPPSISLVLEIFHQVLEALAYCHAQGIIHRDIKPHNIMVDQHQHATLMDFGLVKILDRSGITLDRKILGTSSYLSPETLRGEKVGPPSDLFSLGAVVYELLTGEKAFPGKGIQESGQKILSADPIPVRKLREQCPPGLVEILDGCLKKNTSERYQSASDVLRDLTRVETGSRPVDQKAESPTADLRRSGRDRSAPSGGYIGSPRTRHRLSSIVLLGLGAFLAVTLVIVHRGGKAVPVAASMSGETPEPTILTGCDWAEIRWKSEHPYRGRVRVRPIDSSAESLVCEESVETAHQLRMTLLDPAQRYELTVLPDGPMSGWRDTIRTVSPSALAARLLTELETCRPEGLYRELETEVEAIPFGHRFKRDPATLDFRKRWKSRIVDRLAVETMARSLSEFSRVYRAYFSDPEAPLDQKRRVWMGLESLEDLRIVCDRLKIEFPLPFERSRFLEAALGVRSYPWIESGSLVALDFEAGPSRVDRSSFPDARIVPAGSSGDFYTKRGYPVRKWHESATRMGFNTRLCYNSSGPLSFPPRIEQIEVGLAVEKLVPGNRFVLSVGVDPARLKEVAVFRTPEEGRQESIAGLDPRWVGPKTFLRLDFRVANAIALSSEQESVVSFLVFRFRTGGP